MLGENTEKENGACLLSKGERTPSQGEASLATAGDEGECSPGPWPAEPGFSFD